MRHVLGCVGLELLKNNSRFSNFPRRKVWEARKVHGCTFLAVAIHKHVFTIRYLLATSYDNWDRRNVHLPNIDFNSDQIRKWWIKNETWLFIYCTHKSTVAKLFINHFSVHSEHSLGQTNTLLSGPGWNLLPHTLNMSGSKTAPPQPRTIQKLPKSSRTLWYFRLFYCACATDAEL